MFEKPAAACPSRSAGLRRQSAKPSQHSGQRRCSPGKMIDKNIMEPECIDWLKQGKHLIHRMIK